MDLEQVKLVENSRTQNTTKNKLWMVFVVVLISTVESVQDFNVEWQSWKAVHRKAYKSVLEEKFRLKVFKEKEWRIRQHNARAERGEETYFLKMNHFGDQVGFLPSP